MGIAEMMTVARVHRNLFDVPCPACGSALALTAEGGECECGERYLLRLGHLIAIPAPPREVHS